jgi:hypothetical protein
MSDFDNFAEIPLPNQQNFFLENALTKNKYLITQQIDNFFVAFNNEKKDFTAWQVTTGKMVPKELKDGVNVTIALHK